MTAYSISVCTLVSPAKTDKPINLGDDGPKEPCIVIVLPPHKGALLEGHAEAKESNPPYSGL